MLETNFTLQLNDFFNTDISGIRITTIPSLYSVDLKSTENGFSLVRERTNIDLERITESPYERIETSL